MADNYTIPFGIDSKKFFEGLNAIDQGVDSLTQNVDDAGKSMQKSFEQSAQASANLDKSLTKTISTSENLAGKASELGRELGNALSGKTAVTNGLEKKLENFTTLLTKFTTKAGQKINFNIDTAKLEYFEKLLTSGADQMQVLSQVTAFAQEELSKLDPKSEEFKLLAENVDAANSFLKELAVTTEEVGNKNKSLKKELTAVKAELAALAQAGQEGSQRFKDLSEKAGTLQNQLGDVAQRVKVLASNTKYLDAGIQAVTGLAGAFTATRAAAALFGSENENVNLAIQKVTAAMAFLQGVQAVAAVLNKDSALSVLLFSRAQTTATVSTAALTTATVAEAGATTAATVATKSFTAALLTNPIFLTVAAIAALVVAFAALSSSAESASEALERVNRTLSDSQDFLEAETDKINRETALQKQRAKNAGKHESEILTIEKESLVKRLANQRLYTGNAVALYNRELAAGTLTTKDLEELRKKATKSKNDLKNLEAEFTLKGLEIEKAAADETKEANKKAIQDAIDNAEKLKKINDQRIKFTRELAAAEIDAITNEAQRERAQVQERIKEKIEDLEAEKSLSEEASKIRLKLIKQLRLQEVDEIAKIDKKEAQDKAALQFSALKITNDLQTEGTAKQLENIRLGFIERRNEVNENFKEDEAQRTKLIRLLNQAEADAIKKVTDENENKKLKENEEREVLELEIAARFIGKSKKVEEQKQIAILEVKIKYAKASLETLLAQGNAENSIVVLQAKKTIQDLEKALGIAVKDSGGKGFDMFEFLGLGELSDDQKTAVIGAVKTSLESISTITDFIVGQYQRQIDKRQEMIDQINQSITDLEDQLEKEKELRENGFANNVQLIEAEIAEKKRARDEEIKQQEELQRKQRAVQRAQLALDTITQTSNLITSATQIFKALSGIPIIGVPLAIATIALMTGAFVATKVKAFQLVNAGGQQFGEGGEVDGESHAAGGKKYISTDGRGDVVELEGGEFVTRKSVAEKNKEFLRAMNEGRLGGMSDEALREMLGSLGIHFNDDEGTEALTISNERDEYKSKVFLMTPDNDISETKEIAKDVRYLADRKRQDAERWEDETAYYEKKGNTTTKIPKKQK